MKAVVCGCLLGINCKYNGKNNKNEELLAYLEDKTVVPVCPETMGGLPIPRNPIEWLGGKAIDSDGKDFTKEFRIGAEKALELLKREDPELVVLQPRSPSCGVGKIYDGTFTKHLIEDHGDFAELVLTSGYEVLPEQLSEKFTLLAKKVEE